ncbi:hypothetical protein WHR41_05961 [Cladosporium halotolerans]|uniref:Copper transport protein n=1 Tax=Cladosporium halotolerans TaxID=1052096 RepID=A0AB34KPH9_9PEZI
MAHLSPLVSSEEMPMTFFASTSTPLYIASWQPRTQTQYALTCLFIVLLCVVSRGLQVVKRKLAILFNNRGESGEDEEEIMGCHAEEGGEKQNKSGNRDFGRGRTRTKGLRGSLLAAEVDVVAVGVGYLIMLAAMTMNVGYFLSVIAGTFIGCLLVEEGTNAAGC